MKNVFYFLLGIALIVLTSATTVSVMTVKPATPKSVMTCVGDINHCSKQIRLYIQRGYVVKFISQSQGQYSGYDETRCLVVMEKY
jgi:hypothetical protein